MRIKTAKLFVNGGSQAVRLPADFRFEGVNEVYIRRDSVTGEVILSPKQSGDTWADFFRLRGQGNLPPTFMAERPVSASLHAGACLEER